MWRFVVATISAGGGWWQNNPFKVDFPILETQDRLWSPCTVYTYYVWHHLVEMKIEKAQSGTKRFGLSHNVFLMSWPSAVHDGYRTNGVRPDIDELKVIRYDFDSRCVETYYSASEQRKTKTRIPGDGGENAFCMIDRKLYTMLNNNNSNTINITFRKVRRSLSRLVTITGSSSRNSSRV